MFGLFPHWLGPALLVAAAAGVLIVVRARRASGSSRGSPKGGAKS